jgi:hypothetical protein
MRPPKMLTPPPQKKQKNVAFGAFSPQKKTQKVLSRKHTVSEANFASDKIQVAASRTFARTHAYPG